MISQTAVGVASFRVATFLRRALRGAIKGSQYRRVEREPPAAEELNGHTTAPVAARLT
jgi:hypothetical protein